MAPYPGLSRAESARLRYGLEEEMVFGPRRLSHSSYKSSVV